MSFSFAFISNDAGLLSVALAPFDNVLKIKGGQKGWGLGYYQAGQALLRKQPKTTIVELDFCEKIQNLRADLLIGHMRPNTATNLTTENTSPFRFRNWLFCTCGFVPNFKIIKASMLDSVPDHIKRNIRGSTGSELLFHLFLAFLNDTGRLEDPYVSGAVAGQALASTLTYLDHLQSDKENEPNNFCCLMTNGRIILACRRGIPLAVNRHNSYLNIGRDADNKMISYPHLKSTIVVTGSEIKLGSGWESIDENTIVTVDNTQNIERISPK